MIHTCMQEAVGKLLQTSGTWYEGGGENLYDKNIDDDTHSYALLLPQSFSWLSRSSAAVHPLLSSQSKPAVQHNRYLSSIGNKAMSSCKQSTAGGVTPALRLDAARRVLSAQAPSLLSKESSQHSLSQILLDLVSDSKAHFESDLHMLQLPLADRCLHQHPRASAPLEHKLDIQPGAFDAVLTGTGPQVFDNKRASQYESAETAASGLEAAHSSASSGEGCSLVVPWVVPLALVKSAVFLLRDNTLAAPQPKVSCHDVHTAYNACSPMQPFRYPCILRLDLGLPHR